MRVVLGLTNHIVRRLHGTQGRDDAVLAKVGVSEPVAGGIVHLPPCVCSAGETVDDVRLVEIAARRFAQAAEFESERRFAGLHHIPEQQRSGPRRHVRRLPRRAEELTEAAAQCVRNHRVVVARRRALLIAELHEQRPRCGVVVSGVGGVSLNCQHQPRCPLLH